MSPGSYEELLGQQGLTDPLRRAMAAGRVSHAYMLTGPRGSGKKTLAKLMAKTLLCEDRRIDDTGRAVFCGECSGCRRVDSGNHPDLYRVSAGDARSIGVEKIRELREDVAIKPYSAEKKVYILEDADKLTPGAQNALLKTLEEPPAYVCLLMLTESTEVFLPTVLSRCVKLKMQLVPEREITALLEARGASSARAAAAFSGGSVGQALELMEDEEFGALRQEVTELLARIHETDRGDLIRKAQEIGKDPARTRRTAEFIRMFYRDEALILDSVRMGKKEEGLLGEDIREKLFEAAEHLGEQRLGRIYEAIAEFDRAISAGTGASMALEALLLKIRG